MADYGNQNQEYWTQQDPYAQPHQQQQHQSYNFDMPEQFGQDL